LPPFSGFKTSKINFLGRNGFFFFGSKEKIFLKKMRGGGGEWGAKSSIGVRIFNHLKKNRVCFM